VSSVIENLIDILPKYLLMGKSVNLGDLGTLRVSFSSEGAVDQKQFDASKISGVKIRFTPSPKLKEQLRDLCFELETQKDKESGSNNDLGGVIEG
jgi:predicted histone-like DNA-binding protein